MSGFAGSARLGELLVLSFVEGLLLGTLAAVPGCVAMLAHRCNMPTIFVGRTIQSEAVRGSVAPRTESTGLSRARAAYFHFGPIRVRARSALDPAFSDCVSQSPRYLCGLLNSLTMKTVFGHAIALQRSIAAKSGLLPSRGMAPPFYPASEHTSAKKPASKPHSRPTAGACQHLGE